MSDQFDLDIEMVSSSFSPYRFRFYEHKEA